VLDFYFTAHLGLTHAQLSMDIKLLIGTLLTHLLKKSNNTIFMPEEQDLDKVIKKGYNFLIV